MLKDLGSPGQHFSISWFLKTTSPLLAVLQSIFSSSAVMGFFISNINYSPSCNTTPRAPKMTKKPPPLRERFFLKLQNLVISARVKPVFLSSTEGINSAVGWNSPALCLIQTHHSPTGICLLLPFDVPSQSWGIYIFLQQSQLLAIFLLQENNLK